MNLLDVLLIVLVLAYALSGYWQGFVTGAFATTGLLAGGFLGVYLAPLVLGNADPSLPVSLGALFIVILAASLGQGLLQYVGARLRNRITWQPARAVDAIGGAALSGAAVLVVAWALGVAVTGAMIDGVTKEVNDSALLAGVNDVLPAGATHALNAFNNVVGSSFFPRYLEPFAPEHIVKVGPGPRRLLKDPDVITAGQSVVKIRGEAECGRGIEGSGFVFAPNRLLTNAHVVAGVSDPKVIVGDDTRDATVVYYNSEIDLAVLSFDSSDLKPLVFDDSGKAKEGVAIIGYPQDGPYDVEPARIRQQQRLRSPDIYGSGTVVRDVFSVRGLIRPGNSGGPLVNSAGHVLGVIFAASVTDKDTGYALTAHQVASLAKDGAAGDSRVSTGSCAG